MLGCRKKPEQFERCPLTNLEGLEEVRRQSLETDVASVITARFDLPAIEAMRLYFSSRL